MISIFNTIILFGALQGFIISCLLFFSGNRKQADKVLGILIFLLTLTSLNQWLNMQTWAQSSGLFQTLDALIPMVIIMPVGPLLYLYQRSVLDPEFRLDKKRRFHFLPILIDLVPSIISIGYLGGVISGLTSNRPGPVGEFIDTYNIYADIPRWLSVSAYLVWSIRYLGQYQKLNNQPEITGSIKWLRQLQLVFTMFQLLWLCYLIPYVLPGFHDKLLLALNWYPLYVPLAVLIYWLSIKAYLWRQQMTPNKTEKQSALRSDIVKKTVTALQKAMDSDSLYLDRNLDLNRLSQHIGVPVKTISAVLNQYLQLSFNDFVNGYRINAFIEQYQKPENDHLTIMGIAYDCGFSSQTTFQRVFRLVTGTSPKDFKQTSQQIITKTVF